MLKKGEIIKQVFLKLGENTIYNDNKSELYKTCISQLEAVINKIAYSTAFLFNATTVNLTSVENIDEEYKFNIPIDYLNIIRCDKNYRIENEFIYSDDSKIKVQYCRRISLEEFPDNLFELLVLMTAYEMCLSYSTYNKRLELFQREVLKCKNSLVSQQGFQYWE